MAGSKNTGARAITPQDAFLIFDKWYSEKVPIWCVGSFFGWCLSFKGLVIAISPEEVAVGLNERDAILRLRLGWEDLMFLYGEPKDAPIPVPEEAKELSSLVVGLPFRVTPQQAEKLGGRSDLRLEEVPKREKLFFMELLR